MNIPLCSLNTLWDKFSFCCSYQFTSIQLLLIKILLPHVDKPGFFWVPGDFFKSSVLSLCTVSSLINALNRVNFTEAPGFSSKRKKTKKPTGNFIAHSHTNHWSLSSSCKSTFFFCFQVNSIIRKVPVWEHWELEMPHHQSKAFLTQRNIREILVKLSSSAASSGEEGGISKGTYPMDSLR